MRKLGFFFLLVLLLLVGCVNTSIATSGGNSVATGFNETNSVSVETINSYNNEDIQHQLNAMRLANCLGILMVVGVGFFVFLAASGGGGNKYSDYH